MTIHMGHHHHHASRPSPLDVGEMARFDDTLDECDDAERKRRRIIYLRDAIQKLRTAKSMGKAFTCVLIPFAIIPVFWPFLIFMYVIMKKQGEAIDQQVLTAMQYWDLTPYDIDPTGEVGGGAN